MTNRLTDAEITKDTDEIEERTGVAGCINDMTI